MKVQKNGSQQLQYKSSDLWNAIAHNLYVFLCIPFIQLVDLVGGWSLLSHIV